MKSKIFSFNILKETMKKQIWVPALFILGFFLTLPLMGMVYIEILQDRGGEIAEIVRRYTGLLSGAEVPFLGMMTIGGAVLAGSSGFSWLHSRVKTDFYHSLPIRREKIFINQVILDFLYFAVPYLVNLLLACIVGVVHGVFRGEMLRVLLVSFLYNCMFYMMIYLTAALAMMLTGKAVVGVLGAFVLAFYGPALWAILTGYASTFFDTYASGDTFLTKFLQNFSPVVAYFQCLPSESAGVAGKVWGLGALAIAALAALCFFLYKKRPSEAAGRTMAFFCLGKLIQCLIEIVVILTAGIMFYSVTSRASAGWMVFGVLLGAALSHGILEVIYEGDIRRAMAHPWMLGASVAASLLVIGIFMGDVFGYDNFFPKQDSLSSVYIGVEKYEQFMEGDCNSQQLEAMERQARDPQVYEALQEIVKNSLKKSDESGQIDWRRADGTKSENIRRVQAVYGLSGGRKAYRGYYVDFDQCRDKLVALYDSPDYKKSIYPLLTMAEDEMEKKDLNVEVCSIREEYVTVFSGSQRARADFLRAYCADLLQMGQKTVAQEAPIGRMRLTFKGDEVSGLNSYHEEVEYVIYPSFLKTLALLKEQDVDLPETFSPGEVTKIVLYKHNGKKDADEEEIRDKKRIEKILPCLVSSECQSGLLKVSDKVNALVTIQNKGYDMDVYCFIREDRMPDINDF